MLLYDWKKICKKAGKSSKRVITILESMLTTSMPRNRFDPLYRYIYDDFSGHSFLANAEPLLFYRYKWKDKEIADYIGLASFRSLGEYKATGKLTLDLSHSPVGQDALNNNRLLRIENGNIFFMYEDYKEKQLWQV
jgi:hypothetical protein